MLKTNSGHIVQPGNLIQTIRFIKFWDFSAKSIVTLKIDSIVMVTDITSILVGGRQTYELSFLHQERDVLVQIGESLFAETFRIVALESLPLTSEAEGEP